MIDELDVAFDDEVDRTKPRHRRRRSGGGRSAIALVMTFLLLAVLGGGAWFGYSKVKDFFVAADYDGAGADPVEVTITKGASLTEMGNTLVEADVVKSTKAFTNAAEDEPKSKNIQSGTYRLKKQMAAVEAVKLLLDPKSRVARGITIPEGKTSMEIYEILAKGTNIPVAQFKAAAQDPIALGVPEWWFKRGDGRPLIKSIEGFLYPDTYEFDPKDTAADILGKMVDRFNTVVGEVGFAKAVEQQLDISPFEALVTASLAQAEAGIAADLPKITRVAYNRAYDKKMTLQFDVTTNYWLQVNGKDPKHSGKLLQSELADPKNPYNTEIVVGLPAGPINSPGKAALQAAMKPAAGDWLFFVAVDKTGKSAFAVTDAEHEVNKQRACANGINVCGS